MAKIFSLLCIGFVAFHAASARSIARSGQQSIVSDSGEFYNYGESQPQLNFRNVWDICHTGVWVTHTGQNYSIGPGIGINQIFPDLDYTCEIHFNNVMGSMRFVGLENDYAGPSVTLFAQQNMYGDEMIVFGDEIAQIDMEVHALVTIGTRVELFQEANFGGESICIQHDNNKCRGQVCWFWWLLAGDFPWNINTARSARAGCGANAKHIQPSADKSIGTIMKDM